MNIWKSEPHSSTGKHRILCDDGDTVVGVKVEEVTVVKVEVEPEPVKVEEITVIKEEEDPKPTTFREIKTEPAVSCMSLCLQCCAQHTETQGCLPLCQDGNI
jgi:hypothetical protein